MFFVFILSVLAVKLTFSDNFCGTYIQPHPKSLSCQERDYVLPPSPDRRRDGDEVSHKNCQSSKINNRTKFINYGTETAKIWIFSSCLFWRTALFSDLCISSNTLIRNAYHAN
jgi:hypothetical protein